MQEVNTTVTWAWLEKLHSACSTRRQSVHMRAFWDSSLVELAIVGVSLCMRSAGHLLLRLALQVVYNCGKGPVTGIMNIHADSTH